MAGLYVHVPFCVQRCHYCDFYFVTSHRDVARFVERVCAEIERTAARDALGEPLETVYFGGGTPSVLHPDHFERILSVVGASFRLASDPEITAEVNPDGLDESVLTALRRLGVNRLSIGVQSFRNEELTWMNRRHTARQAIESLSAARLAGFEDVSADLIFGLPGQSADAWAENLRRVVDAGVDHVSLYGLTVKPRTVLGKRVLRGLVFPMPDEAAAERYLTGCGFLEAAGLEQYEVSNFARPGHRSKHNALYWNHRNVVGVGPSAHSFVWNGDRAERRANVASLRLYLERIEQGMEPSQERETLDRPELATEALLLRLRTVEGIDLIRARDHYGLLLEQNRSKDLEDLQAAGLIRWDPGRWVRLTRSGFSVADAVTARLL